MSASILYWTGAAGDLNFMTAGNWNTAEDGSGSSIAPGAGGAGDSLYIRRTSDAISGGVTAISVALLDISHGGSVGTAGSPLNIAVSGTLRIRTAAATHYIAAVSAGTIVTTDIKQTGTGKVFLAGPGAYTTIKVGTNCQVDVAANGAVTTLKQSGGSIDVAYNTSAITTHEVAGGVCRSSRPATTANITGTLYSQGLLAAITTANVFTNGKHYNWTPATITTSDVRPGGYATAKGSPYNAIITNRTSYEGSSNYLDSINQTAGAPDSIGQG